MAAKVSVPAKAALNSSSDSNKAHFTLQRHKPRRTRFNVLAYHQYFRLRPTVGGRRHEVCVQLHTEHCDHNGRIVEIIEMFEGWVGLCQLHSYFVSVRRRQVGLSPGGPYWAASPA